LNIRAALPMSVLLVTVGCSGPSLPTAPTPAASTRTPTTARLTTVAAAGLITNRDTGRPILATVSFDGAGATSEGEGRFSISGLPANSAVIMMIVAPGYENVVEAISIHTSDLRIDRELSPKK
jgi:hypothetical protein